MTDITVKTFDVSAYKRISDGKTLYYGIIFRDGEQGPGLEEYEGKLVKPGFFENLDDLADTIKKVLEEEEFTDLEREDLFVAFTNRRAESIDGDAYINISGVYLRRPLNEKELEQLVILADKKLRKKFWKNS